MAVVDGQVVWVGQDTPGIALYGDSAEVVHLDGAFVAPAFVDAHVHATSAGLLLLLELLLLPQADSAIALIKHAAATTRNDLGRRMRARMLLCGAMLPNLLRVSARLGTARL